MYICSQQWQPTYLKGTNVQRKHLVLMAGHVLKEMASTNAFAHKTLRGTYAKQSKVLSSCYIFVSESLFTICVDIS